MRVSCLSYFGCSLTWIVLLAQRSMPALVCYLIQTADGKNQISAKMDFFCLMVNRSENWPGRQIYYLCQYNLEQG